MSDIGNHDYGAANADPYGPTPTNLRETVALPADEAGARRPEIDAHSLSPSSTEPKFLGRYVVMDALGHGGMGTVFMAFDLTLDRPVALKVLHDKHTTRLLREAQALAKLSHPNVVQVYEVGEVEGQAFVAMELVEGQTLRAWMRQNPRPSWTRCIEVFVQAGMGLASAHERGLVHRDFKPSNAIIDDKGRARVLDFGLARQVEQIERESSPSHSIRTDKMQSMRLDDSLTDTGAVLGTPAYMPPEQIEGLEVDARSDQFSFCVSLYEAVYGERPFEGSSMAALMVSMTHGDVRPAPKGTKVPGALRKVLLRGLARSPDQRWPSMEVLLAELRRLATPRRRSWLALGVVGGLGLVGVGLGMGRYAEVMDRCTGAATQLAGVWDEARKQEVRAAILGTELPYAPDTWVHVERQLDGYREDWANKYTEVCEATSVRKEQSVEVMDLRMECLEGRRGALRATVKVLGESDAPVVQKATHVASSLPALARCDDVEALRAEVPPPEDPQVAQEVEALRERLAEIVAMMIAGRYTPALEQLDPVVQRAEALAYLPLVVEATWRRGVLRSKKSDYAGSERDLNRAYMGALEHGHDQIALHAAQDLTHVVGYQQRRSEEGRQWGETALVLAKRSGDDIEVAHSSNNLATVLSGQGDYEEARRHLERAVLIREKALGAEHPHVATSLHSLGAVLFGQGEYEEARRHLERAVLISENVLGSEHPHVANSVNNLGAVFARQEEYEAAERCFTRALLTWEGVLGADHPQIANGLTNLGNIFVRQGEYAKAIRHFERALLILEKSSEVGSSTMANSLGNLGTAFFGQGDFDEAKRYFERALLMNEKVLGPDHPDVAMSSSNLGEVLAEQGEHEGAKRYLERALRIREKALGAGHHLVAYSLVELARLALAQGQVDAARAHAERAVATGRSHEMPPKVIAKARFVLAQSLWPDPSERARARELAEHARRALVQVGTGGEVEALRVEAEQWLVEHRVR